MVSNLHNDVRAVRTRLHLSQSELGEKCGVTRQTVAAIEGGNYSPSIVLALSIAAVLSTPLIELFWLEKEKISS